MGNFLEKIEKYEKVLVSISISLVVFFPLIDFIIKKVGLFFGYTTYLHSVKDDFYNAVIVLVLFMNFKAIKSLIDSNFPKNYLRKYENQFPDYSELINYAHEKRNCNIYILSNSFSTIWNGFVKKLIQNLDHDNTHDSLTINIIKKRDGLNIERDVSLTFGELQPETKDKIKIKLQSTTQLVFFTGVYIEEEVLAMKFKSNINRGNDHIRTWIYAEGENNILMARWFKDMYSSLSSDGASTTLLFDSHVSP